MTPTADVLPVDPEVVPPPRRRITFTKVVLVVVCLLIAAMWVYAFGFASKKAAYRVDDAAWRERAQAVCTTHEEQRLELVDVDGGIVTDPTDAQILEHADILDRATDILEDQLAETTAQMPTSARDRSLVDEYAGYWRIVIADRRAHTAKLRNFEVGLYHETAVDGSPVSNLITDFTVVNEMPACSPPGDIAQG
jgi:hypothetical protein